MKNNPIKLYKCSEDKVGLKRFQSQLYLGKLSCDFIMENDNIMKCLGNGKNGIDFYEYNQPYIIVDNIQDMKTQII